MTGTGSVPRRASRGYELWDDQAQPSEQLAAVMARFDTADTTSNPRGPGLARQREATRRV